MCNEDALTRHRGYSCLSKARREEGYLAGQQRNHDPAALGDRQGSAIGRRPCRNEVAAPTAAARLAPMIRRAPR